MKNIDEIKKLCGPVARYLEENHNPHCTIIITSNSVKLVSDEISIPVSKQND